MPKVTVLPDNRATLVEPGELLIRAGEKAGVKMEAGCFSCFCGTCLVEVVSGMESLAPPSDEELEVLDQWNKDAQTFRLSCCAKVSGPGDIVILAGHQAG
jgi:ferredoxin, 2Fe-2S